MNLLRKRPTAAAYRPSIQRKQLSPNLNPDSGLSGSGHLSPRESHNLILTEHYFGDILS